MPVKAASRPVVVFLRTDLDHFQLTFATDPEPVGGPSSHRPEGMCSLNLYLMSQHASGLVRVLIKEKCTVGLMRTAGRGHEGIKGCYCKGPGS